MIMENNAHPLLNPVTADQYEAVPASLQKLAAPAP